MNVSYLLTNGASKYPAKTAIISGEKRLTYEAFNDRVNRLGNAMKALGIRKGDRMGLLLFNTYCFVEAYFAGLKLGAIVVPLNYRLVCEEIKFLINNSGVTILFYDGEFHETIAKIQESARSPKHFVAIGAQPSHASHGYESFLSSGNPEELEFSASNDDPCQIIYTSATTGKPKGVVLSHRNIIWNMFNTIIGREHRPGEVSLIISPLFHVAALNNHFTIQVALGGTSILVKRFDPEIILTYIEQEKVNVISGSPAMFNLLLQYTKLDHFETNSITKCTSGSAALPDKIREQLLEVFPNTGGISDLYGCTEGSPTITALSARDSFRKKNSVGLPAPFVEVRVVDEKGKPSPPNQVGELVCRGPNVMEGYWKDRQATAEAIKNSWLFTGDLARVDEDGYVYIVDRKKDMIISGGENIYPREIEGSLLRHPSMSDVAVIGVPHEIWGETVKAFIVVKEGAKIGEAEVIEFCRQNMASYKKPTIVEFVDLIPRNAAGKTLKKMLGEAACSDPVILDQKERMGMCLSDKFR